MDFPQPQGTAVNYIKWHEDLHASEPGYKESFVDLIGKRRGRWRVGQPWRFGGKPGDFLKKQNLRFI